MDLEPQVKVGILTAKSIDFTLTGLYTLPTGEIVSGKQSVSISDSGICINWDGKSHTSIDLTPTSYSGDSFELEGVTIGVDFHWERKESQRFRGSLRLIAENGAVTAINIVNIEDYLVSVISSEMKATSSLSLLRAHAVISRSWILSNEAARCQCPKAIPKLARSIQGNHSSNIGIVKTISISTYAPMTIANDIRE